MGCADAMIERGIKLSAIDYYDPDFNLLIGADFNGLIGKTDFPFFVIIRQNITEDVLIEKLENVGVPIFRPYRAVGMRKNSKDSQLVDVSFENGQSITAKYVIGADGSKSTVRIRNSLNQTNVPDVNRDPSDSRTIRHKL